MGCDIHIVLERRRKPNERWIGVWSSDNGPNRRAQVASRDYDFFGAIAGVRGRPEGFSNYPRNLPEDVSQLAWSQYMRCPTDYHSVSHMSASEFCTIHHKVNPDKSRAENVTYDLLGLWGDEDEGEHRVVFWFDN